MTTADNGPRPARAHLLVLVAVGAGIAVLAPACGGAPADAVAHIGTTTSTTAAATGSAGSPSPSDMAARLEKYSSCMRSHGVTGFPDPIVSVHSIELQLPPGLGQGTPRFAAAQGECRSLLPLSPTNPGFTTKQEADYLKAAACMRAHSIVGFPDPDFTDGRVTFPLPAGMNANSSQFEAAREICQKLIPQGLPYSGGN
jgi:hypothetical protein